MTSARKIGIVAGGYAAAAVVALAAVGVDVATTRSAQAQASSGMLAFGDALLFVAVFGVAALAPTGIALFFLRPYRPVWIALATIGVGVAFTGLAAAALFSADRHAAAPAPIATLADVSVLRILLAPIVALVAFVCAAFSPHRWPRLTLLAVGIAEMGVGTFGAMVWIVPMLFARP